MKKYIEFFATGKKKKATIFGEFLNNLSRKQKFSLITIIVVLTSNTILAQFQFPSFTSPTLAKSFQTVATVLLSDKGMFSNTPFLVSAGLTTPLLVSFATSYFIVDIVKSIMLYITGIQSQSIETIAKMDFGSENMFDHIVAGLTIFAVIGCVYKLVVHFLRTERLDNVNAYLGYFSYIGMFVLFTFSSKIVDYVVSLNQPMNKNAVTQIFVKIDNELNENVKKDFKESLIKLEELEVRFKNTRVWRGDTAEMIGNRFEAVTIRMWDMGFKHMFKYIYYAFFSTVMAVVLAIPAFSITFMVKVLLGIMVAGAKLVFLISFIPGFENTWRTYMLNLVNVILWIPIFNGIIAFLTNIVVFTINDNSMGTGQIIWLSLVVVIGAYNSITLTTVGAGTIISGAGASMAGAMGSLSSMNAASMVAGASQAALNAGITLATGGSSSGTIGAIQKFLK